MCLKIENISKSQIIKKIDFINYLKKIKNDKIKFCFNINEDNIFLLNDDIFEIFDVIFIDYSANFFNIIKKILKYNKMIILKINDLNKIKKIIENNIVKYIIKT